MGMTETARRACIDGWLSERERARRERVMEERSPRRPYVFPDPLEMGRTDFWAIIDERDSAAVMELGLTADYEGCEVVFANDEHNITGLPSATLAALFFPEAALRLDRIPGTHSLVSIAKARRLLGFEPEHSVSRWFQQPSGD